MKLVEVENIVDLESLKGLYPFENPTDPTQNATQFNYKTIPALVTLVKDVVKTIMETNMNLGFSEEELFERAEVQGQSYTGDVFVYHYDGYSEEYRSLEPHGQRILTGLVYLNDNFDGGLTHFLKDDMYITPKAGNMCLFSNCNEDFTIDLDSKHRATEVSNGKKHIFNVWFREKITHIKLSEDEV